MIQIHPLTGIGEVPPGAELAALLSHALVHCGIDRLRAGDVLVVTQKIVSKAEDRFAELAAVAPGAEALRLAAITRKDARLVELVLRESVAVVRAAPHVLITRHRCGAVMANAGIDRSNLGPAGEGRVLLLPQDPDRSAAALHAALAARFGGGFGLVISDSFGRPWRHGVVNVAIGAAGLPSLVDRRGEPDRDGRTLEITQVAFADALAAAAGLATGEAAESLPAALIRGLAWTAPARPAAALLRPLAEDLFQ
jgi:coenzyme F420-0:L-glutamate ligase/coenzyme F420-1:gamma-L-glutamate ligase